MTKTATGVFTSLQVRVSILRPPDQVYAFASNPENLPKWASGLANGVRKEGNEWLADSPMGKIKIRFAEENEFGVLDHDVTLASGETFHNPMRVIANGEGSEIVFTLYRLPGVSDKAFAKDAAIIRKDLEKLKKVMEKPKGAK